MEPSHKRSLALLQTRAPGEEGAELQVPSFALESAGIGPARRACVIQIDIVEVSTLVSDV